MRKTHSLLWQQPEYIAKQIEASHSLPNKAELQLQRILDDLFPDG